MEMIAMLGGLGADPTQEEMTQVERETREENLRNLEKLRVQLSEERMRFLGKLIIFVSGFAIGALVGRASTKLEG